MPDLYSPCPCGSGKNFKWCCRPIYAGIEQAHELDANGQHEAALRAIDEVVRQHPDNPEAWGQKAQLLYANDRTEEAEEALQKAFDVNPSYPYGLLLRALFRLHEGEPAGALLLARKAADAYHPDARDALARVYSIIFECEMKMNRPVAGRAALAQVLRFQPADQEARAGFDGLFGPNGRLPACARHEYAFLSPPAGVTSARRTAWDDALREASTSARLSDPARAFASLTEQDPADGAAWFNLGLARAWLGDNAGALDALDRFLDLETDEARTDPAAALAEVLRAGAGLEERSDYCEYAFALQIRDPGPLNQLIQEWADARRIVPMQSQVQGAVVALLLETTTASLITVGSPAADSARLAGYLVAMGPMVQVTSPRKEAFDRLKDELRQRLALGLGELEERRTPIQFQDVTADAWLFPFSGEAQASNERVLEHARHYYEETWIHQPRRSLAGNTPVDAAGHGKLRRQLRGVIQLVQDCAPGTMIAPYDFDRLRRQLGLATGPAAEAAPTAAATGLDVGSMGAAELSTLDVGTLSDEQLEQAYQAAQKLDAADLAARFAQSLVARPARAEQPDLFPWYSFLSQHALRTGHADAALDYVNEGERIDCERNEGRRRDEYELRRGQVLTRRGEADAAGDVFQRLIDRVPANLRYRGAAAEAMLALKQPARALRFAEDGLQAARRQNDRDSEQYLQELVEAARKQGA